jgi:hypothetical protein
MTLRFLALAVATTWALMGSVHSTELTFEDGLASFAHFGQSLEFDSPHCAATALTEGK